MLNAFQAIQKLMSCREQRAMTYIDRLNMFFIDFMMMPLLCYENYITTFSAGQDKLPDLERLATCNDLFSMGDTISNQVFNGQCWGMLPDLGRISVLAPCSLMRGFVPYTKFPEVLGKFNTQKKSNRLIRELKDSCGH